MKKFLLLFCLLTATFGFALESHAYLVTFDTLAHADDTFADHGNLYTEAGFRFESIDPLAGGLPGLFSTAGTQLEGIYTGSTALFNNTYRGDTVLTRDNGGTFDLNSLSLAETVALGEAVQVAITGMKQDGSTVSLVITLDGLYGAQNFVLNDYKGLVSATWTQVGDGDFHQFDNVDATPTPIPAAALLFGSGLLGLVGLRRKAE
jgi:hypothetical protein